jgi:2,4-dienoyl-CoA reductase-like NADH-dependent reductase (Old Yellow Enzyme family)
MEEEQERDIRLPDEIRRDMLLSPPFSGSTRSRNHQQNVHHQNVNRRNDDYNNEEEMMVRLAMEVSQREYEENEHRQRLGHQYRQEFRMVFQRLRQYSQHDPIAKRIYEILEILQEGKVIPSTIWTSHSETTEITKENVQSWIRRHIKSPTYVSLTRLVEDPDLSYLWE